MAIDTRSVVPKCLFSTCVLILSACAYALTPSPPNVSREFDPISEASVRAIASQPIGKALEALAQPEFIFEPDLLHKAVYAAFHAHRTEAIAAALRVLRQPTPQFGDENAPDNPHRLLVAKAVFEVFPEESPAALLESYETGDTATRSNVIRVAGNVADEGRISQLLVKALDDTAESLGDGSSDGPLALRLCDLAYNQLVLRYDVAGVLRMIRATQTKEVRDHHISLLRAKLLVLGI